MKKRYFYVFLVILLMMSLISACNFNLAKKPLTQENYDLAGGKEKQVRGFPQREIIDLASEYPGVFYRQGSAKIKKVALTFDDGPDNKYTVQILDVLKKNNVQAAFFVVGKRCELYPDILKRMAKEGHIIGNHTYNHPNLVKLSDSKALKELNDTDAVINKLVGYRPALFRSPYGSLDRKKVEIVKNSGYKVIAWNVDSLDWKGLTAAEVKTNILENTTNGSIILQHSAGGVGEDLSGTVKALDDIIRVLKKDGYQFVTVDKLLGISYKK